MAAHTIAAIHDIGADILNSTQGDNGLILLQIGDSTNNEVRGDNAELWQHVGFAARPGNATAGSPSCQAVVLEQTDYDVVIATRDHRTAAKAGTLGPGETALYAAGPDGTGTALISLKSTDSEESITAKVADTKVEIKSDGSVNIGVNPTKYVALAPDLTDYLNSVQTMIEKIAAQVTVLSSALVLPPPPDYVTALADLVVQSAKISLIASTSVKAAT